ncbi:MAG: single-stranded DNA-binding protein [Eggerthellaceae bacterium]|nr:single-stranded DNA-binding protein [Eggerthellaceae bacterium]
MSINKVMITGNLTRDPETRSTASGTSILSFSVAVNDRRKDPATGEWGDYANYIDCTYFAGSSANRIEYLQRNLAKGTLVAVEGKLRWSQWEARDGSGKRSKIEVIVDDLVIMSRGNEGNAGNSGANYGGGYGNAQYGNQSYGQPQYGNQSYGQAQAPAQHQAPAYPNAGTSAGYSGGPNIDATSSVYDEDIPF